MTSHILIYFNIQTTPYSLSDKETLGLVNSNTVNTLLLVYDEREDDGFINKIINSVTLVSLTENGKFLYQLNPLIKINQESSIRDALSSQQEIDLEESSLDKLIEDIQITLGLRIDRYIIFTTDSFNRTFNLNEDELNLFSINLKEEIRNGVISEQANYISQIVTNEFGVLNTYLKFLNSQSLIRNLRTNFSDREFINFILNLGSNKPTFSEYFRDRFARIDEENDYLIDSIIVADEFRDFFRDIEIVAEQAQLEIYSSTEISGLAGGKSREFSNAGISVVAVGNYVEDVDENILFVKNEEDLVKFEKTINIVNLSLKGILEIKIDEYDYNQTGDLILVLGDGRSF